MLKMHSFENILYKLWSILSLGLLLLVHIILQVIRGTGNAAERYFGKSDLLGFQPTPPRNITSLWTIHSTGILLPNNLRYRINTVYALIVSTVIHQDFNTCMIENGSEKSGRKNTVLKEVNLSLKSDMPRLKPQPYYLYDLEVVNSSVPRFHL